MKGPKGRGYAGLLVLLQARVAGRVMVTPCTDASIHHKLLYSYYIPPFALPLYPMSAMASIPQVANPTSDLSLSLRPLSNGGGGGGGRRPQRYYRRYVFIPRFIASDSHILAILSEKVQYLLHPRKHVTDSFQTLGVG